MSQVGDIEAELRAELLIFLEDQDQRLAAAIKAMPSGTLIDPALANRQTDQAVKNFLLANGDGRVRRSELDNLRFKIAAGDLVGAKRLMARMRNAQTLAAQIAIAPDIRTGRTVRAASAKGGAAKRGANIVRNAAMARQYEAELAANPNLKEADTKAKIGKRYGLARTAAIDAIAAGLQDLVRNPAKPD